MNVLLFAIPIIIVVALLVYAVDYLSLTAPFNGLLKFLIILVGVVMILNRAGMV